MKHYCDGGEAIVQAFRNLGIDYVFSSPGSEWGSLWEAFARQQVGNNPGPKYLSCWHETLAVDLAMGYTAVTGKMQAVVLHAGVGLMQGSMGVHAARKTGTPMIVMSGESLSLGDDEEFDPGSQWYQSLNIVGGPQRILEPLVKWSTQATSPQTLHEMVMRAGELAQRQPIGPTYLNVPIETMLEDWTPPTRLRTVPPPPKDPPHEADVAKVAQLLVAAKAPLIITESAGREPEGYQALKELAELLAIPVVEGNASEINNFPKDHLLHMGYRVRPFLASADLVLVVRAKTPWYPPNKGPATAEVVVIDEAPFRDSMVYQNLQANHCLEAYVPYTLRCLCETVKNIGFNKAMVEERRQQVASCHEKLIAGLVEEAKKAAEMKEIHPITLCRALGEVMPQNAIYVDETTSTREAIRNYVPFLGPQSYFKVPGGLGQGLGIALGVKLAAQHRPVVSLIGDGALLYNPVPQSLGFSRDADLPILIVVFNNRGYRAMKRNQLAYYPDGAGKEHGIFLGETINVPSFGDLTKAFDGYGVTVEKAADLKPALQEGLKRVQAGTTTIVNVPLL